MLAVMIVVKITNSVAKTNKSKNIQYRLQFGLSSLNLVVLKHGSFKMFEAIWNVNAIALCVLWVLRILRQQFAVHQKRVKRSAFEMQRQSINGTFHVQYTDRYSMEPGKYWKRAKREWQEIQSLSVQYRLTQCWPFPMPTNCSKRKKIHCMKILKLWLYKSYIIYIKWNVYCASRTDIKLFEQQMRIQTRQPNQPVSVNETLCQL